ncbi:T6SS effector amidase Tae4 family protein [Agromyces bauzanensis]
MEHEHRAPNHQSASGSAPVPGRDEVNEATGMLRLQRLAGNVAVASALAGRHVRATPSVVTGIVQREAGIVQRAQPTRAENLAALQQEVSDAVADPAKWKAVALRLNGFDTGDLPTACTAIPKAHLQSARTAVERSLAGWPAQAAILAALDARARKQKVSMRPTGSGIWAAYSKVGYNVWSGEGQKNEVWKYLGGSVGKKYLGGNTCAARVSWAMNYGGYPVTGRGEINDPRKTFAGKKGDGRSYIVWVPSLQGHLTNVWGAPDRILRTNAAAVAFEKALGPDEVAVFAGPHHSGLIKKGYSDAYVKSDPGVMPVAVWKLP